MNLAARCLVEGEAEGAVALVVDSAQFLGRLRSGERPGHRSLASGLWREIAGRVLAMPSGRGSSSASSVLAEAIRRGTAPAAIILTIADPIITVGAIVARKLYGKACPVVVCDAADFERLSEGMRVRVIAREGLCAIVAAGV